MGNNWNKTADRQSAYKSGNAVKHTKGQGGVGYPIKSVKDAKDAAGLLKMHGGKYSPAKRAKIRAHIKRHAKRLGATVNLANDDQASDFGNNVTGAGQGQAHAQAGKTRAQPRPAHGRFGKKGATNGEQAMPGADQDLEPPPPDPSTFIATANQLQVGQSFALPDNMAKVKRLGTGYQLVKMDGSENKVVKSLAEVHTWIAKLVPKPKGGQPT